MTASDFITSAEEKKAAAEKRLEELLLMVGNTKEEISEWSKLILRAESLADDMAFMASKNKPAKEPSQNGVNAKLKIRTSSLAGAAAKLLLESGPLSLTDLAVALMESGHGSGENFRTVLNTALWRRREDLFNKSAHGEVSLRTKDIEFTGEDSD